NFYIVLSAFVVISGGLFFFMRRETPHSPKMGEDPAAPRLAVKSIRQPAQEARGENAPASNARRVTEKTERIIGALKKLGRAPLSYDQPGEAAEYYRLKRLPEGESQIPVERYFEARERMRRMPRYSTRQNRLMPSRAEMKSEPEEAALGEWTPLGPGNVGGRTRALLIKPNDPNLMYAAGVAGGGGANEDGGGGGGPLGGMVPNHPPRPVGGGCEETDV